MHPFHKEKIKILAFDIDGTLFSSENIILETYIESIQRFIQSSGRHIPIPSKEKIIEQVGLPVKQIFRNLLPELNEEERDSISDSVLTLLREKIFQKKGTLYSSVHETILELFERKYTLCIASNGRAPYINAILQAYELEPYFEELVVIDYKDFQSKGDILKAYIEKYNLLGENALMIGDRKSDLDAAVDGGSPFAFCEYGHADKGEIESYSIKLNSIRDLLNFL
jgi:phosphoglycolate phosphatase